MAWDLTTGTPSKTCTSCGKIKHVDEFCADRNGSNGTRPLCKPCKNKQQAKQRAVRAMKAKQDALHTLSVREVEIRDNNLTPPRTFLYHYDQPYRTEPSYVRNNGNKHIPSKGLST